MPAPRIVTACMIVIGNEILSGRTRDANLHYIAQRLNELGVRLKEARVVADEEPAIIAAVNDCRARYDYVFTSGGIGPTHDDITADAVAKAFDVTIDIDPRARTILEKRYEPGMLNEARMRMARIPAGAALVPNPVSGAPGFRLGNVYVMAGVPAILQAMFESIRHELIGGDPLHARTLNASLAEGQLAKPLAELQTRFADVDMGSYPWYRGGKFGTSIVLRSTDKARLDAATEEMRGIMQGFGAEPMEGEFK